MLLGFEAANLGGEMLDGLFQEFGVTGGEILGVRAGELDGEIGDGAGVLLDGEAEVEASCGEDAPEKTGDLRLCNGWFLH